MSKFYSVQVLRGIAACGVVVLHERFLGGGPVDHSMARLGGAGVDLFFVISGFIMATIAKPSPGQFLFDRFWRIFPLWLLAVLPWLALQPVLTPPIVLASVTLWPVYDQFTVPALGLGWTLSFEMLFYVAIALGMRTRPALPLALFAVALVGGALTHAPLFDFLGNPMICEFLFGVLIAQLPRSESAALPLLIVAAIGFAAAPLTVFSKEMAFDAAVSGWRTAFWGVPAALLVYGCLCAERMFAHRWIKPLVRIGDASYSIYLFHRLTGFIEAPWPLKVLAGVALGLVIHLLVERPILRLKPRRAARTDPGAPPAAAPAVRIPT